MFGDLFLQEVVGGLEVSTDARLDEVLYNLAETCRVLAVLLWPFIPATSEKIYAQLGLKDSPEKFSEAAWGRLTAGHAIGEPAALFPRKDLAPK